MNEENCLLRGEQLRRIKILYRDISTRCLERIFYNNERKQVLEKISNASIILLQNAILISLGKSKTSELENANINQDNIEDIFKTILFEFYLSPPPSEMYNNICKCFNKYGISLHLLMNGD